MEIFFGTTTSKCLGRMSYSGIRFHTPESGAKGGILWERNIETHSLHSVGPQTLRRPVVLNLPNFVNLDLQWTYETAYTQVHFSRGSWPGPKWCAWSIGPTWRAGGGAKWHSQGHEKMIGVCVF